MAKGKSKAPTGEALVKQQVITREDLTKAQEREKATGTPWYRQLLQMKKLNFDVVNDVLYHEFHSRGARESHINLGDALLERGSVTEEQIQDALAEQKRNGKLLGTILLDSGYVTRETIALVLSDQYGMRFASASDTPSAQEALDLVPESTAKQKEFIPVSMADGKLTVLISGPQSPERLKDIGIILGVRIDAIMTAVDDMSAEIEARYSVDPQKTRRKSKKETAKTKTPKPVETAGRKTIAAAKPSATKKEAANVANDVEVVETQTQSASRFDEIAQQAQGGDVVKLVSTIIEGAVNAGATDVHLDPQEPEMRVRYRIDGILHDVMSIPPDIENAVVSRMKIMADVDITETRRPQDGHISMEIGDSEFDIRIASLPTYLGERIVLRLLDQSSVLAGVRDLGLETEDEARVLEIIDQPYGMILVTGPTGSGKTTTLYSCLNQKNVMTDSIVTLEDPVEYQLSGINQVQIEPDIDLTFATVLRASLRQDIDVLLVGEIRDPETARIAVRAAMTGHLVFSTLHTNDAPEAITTLRNMGVPSYLISSALTAVIAQRLVRQICPDCKKRFTPPKALLKSLKLPESTKSLHRGEGCENCYGTGSKGRTGIFEVLDINASIRRLIAAEESAEKITKAAKLKTMADRCRLKVKQGVITPEEFLRVIRT